MAKPLTQLQRRAFILAAILWVEPRHTFAIMKAITKQEDAFLTAQFSPFFHSRKSYYATMDELVAREYVEQKPYWGGTHNSIAYVNHLTSKGQDWFLNTLFRLCGDEVIDVSNTQDLLVKVAELAAKEEQKEAGKTTIET